MYSCTFRAYNTGSFRSSFDGTYTGSCAHIAKYMVRSAASKPGAALNVAAAAPLHQRCGDGIAGARTSYTVRECTGLTSMRKMWRGALMLSHAGDTLPCSFIHRPALMHCSFPCSMLCAPVERSILCCTAPANH